ncbi:MAG: GGDEF domain-containing protein [Thermoanaerobaculia bacterium]|nr:GGDEF domain-containing protein [Thermoanaerobaculia bacterium]
MGRARGFARGRFERELAAASEGVTRAELLRLLLVEWTGVTVPLNEVTRLWARVERAWDKMDGALGAPVSLLTALLHEFHSRLGRLKEPRLLSDDEVSALRVNAITDPLTGLYNRRFLHDHLDREVSRAERTGGVVSILMLDLAGFKSINDRLGHPVGDGILVRTAKVIRESLRVVDAGCRYGGDEFVTVLPNSDVVHSLAVAERIRHKVAAIRLPLRVGLKMGLNYGVATFPTDGRLLDFLLKMSDIRLYASKRQNAKAFERTRRFPRFNVPGLTVRMGGNGNGRKSTTSEVHDISYGGISFVTHKEKTPDRIEGEILQRHSGEPHRVAMRRVSAVPLADGRMRVGCAYVH